MSDPADTAAVAQAVKRLENRVCEVRNMANVTATLLENAIEVPLAGDRPTMFYITEQQRDALLFSAVHAEQMATALRDAYYEALAGRST